MFLKTAPDLVFLSGNSAKTGFLNSHHDNKRQRPRMPTAGSRWASKVRHVQESARRLVDLRWNYFDDGSKPRLNWTLRLLSFERQHIYTWWVYSSQRLPMTLLQPTTRTPQQEMCNIKPAMQRRKKTPQKQEQASGGIPCYNLPAITNACQSV